MDEEGRQVDSREPITRYLCMHMMSFVYGECLTLKPLAVRIPKEIEKEILEVVEREKLDKATVVRNLLEMGIVERRKQTALELLRDGKVTFTKAAEMAKLSLWEFADLVKQRNIEWVRYTPEEIENEIKEASVAESK